jgi:hypothetical protein
LGNHRAVPRNDAAGGRAGALVFADDLGITSFQKTNWKQISPRIGFAYAFTPKFVFRGGYGVNNIAPVANFSTPSTFGYNGSIAVNSSNTALQYAQDPVMYLHQPYPSFSGVLPNKDQAPGIGQGFTYISPDGNKLGIVQNFNLGFNIQLPQESVLEISYIGNRGQRLTSGGLDALNQLPVSALSRGDDLIQPLRTNPQLGALPYASFTGTLAQSLRRFPQYTSVGQFLPNFGRSSYDSLQVMTTRRMTKDLSLLFAYTFSKGISNTSSPLDGIGAQDVYNRNLEKSVVDYNYPHVAKFTWIYALPFGKGKMFNMSGVADKVLGGWTLTGIHQYRSGDPISVSISGYNNAIFSGSIRPDWLTGVPTVIDTGAAVQTNGGTPYLNPAAFGRLPATPNGIFTRLGTAPRVLPNVRTPMFSSEDIGLMKSFYFNETTKFELRMDAFNAFNRAGRGGLNTDVASPLFGRLTGQQYGPRSVQLAARFEF